MFLYLNPRQIVDMLMSVYMRRCRFPFIQQILLGVNEETPMWALTLTRTYVIMRVTYWLGTVPEFFDCTRFTDSIQFKEEEGT